jgi:hypothetical protein
MAAVTKVDVHPIESNVAKIGRAAAALAVLDPVVIDPAAAVHPRYACTYKKAVAEGVIHGVVVKPAVAGGPVEVMTDGEFDGLSGLTPGRVLSVAAGSIDTVAHVDTGNTQLIALSASRIWVNL